MESSSDPIEALRSGSFAHTIDMAQQAAVWMREELQERGILYEYKAACEIAQRFWSEQVCWTLQEGNGDPVINDYILHYFEELVGDKVIWIPKYRYWRLRE